MQENDGLRTKVEMLDEVDAEYRINPDEHIRGEPELRAKLHQAERAITTLKKRLIESEFVSLTLLAQYIKQLENCYLHLPYTVAYSYFNY